MSGFFSGFLGSPKPRNSSPGAHGASMVLLERKVAYPTLAEVVFAGLDAEYDEYEVRIANAVPTADSVNFYAQFSNNNGGSFFTSAYQLALSGYNSSAAAVNAASTSNAQMQIVGSNDLDNAVIYGGFSGVTRLFGMGRSDLYGRHSTEGAYVNTAQGIVTVRSAGLYAGATGINAVRFIMAATTFAAGTFSLFGIKKQ